MTHEVRPEPPPAGRLLAQIGGSVVVATALAVALVLPAEYGIDPTGIGGVLGLDKLYEPPEVIVETLATAPIDVFRLSEAAFRSDTIELDIDPKGGFFDDLEYKVTALAGQTVVFSWTSTADVHFEFHGHTFPDAGGAIRVMDYMKGNGGASHGTLVAPIDGIHGWYFRNDGDTPGKIVLELSGFYLLEPGMLF